MNRRLKVQSLKHTITGIIYTETGRSFSQREVGPGEKRSMTRVEEIHIS